MGEYSIRVTVKDKANNYNISNTENYQTDTNTPPEIESVSYYTKDTRTITVKAKATDIDKDKLTYKIYVSTDGIEWGTAKQTLANQEENIERTLKASGLSNYTEYYWKVEVSDGKTTVESEIQEKIRTQCPGGNMICDYNIWCSICLGTGAVYLYPSGQTFSSPGYQGWTPYQTSFSCDWCKQNASNGWRVECSYLTTSGYTRTVDWLYVCSTCGIKNTGEYGEKLKEKSGISIEKCPQCGLQERRRCRHNRFYLHRCCIHGDYYSVHD